MVYGAYSGQSYQSLYKQGTAPAARSRQTPPAGYDAAPCAPGGTGWSSSIDNPVPHETPRGSYGSGRPSFMRPTNSSMSKSRVSSGTYDPPSALAAYEHRFQSSLDCPNAADTGLTNTSITRAPGAFIPAQSPEDQGKYTIVFDLDETLVYAREGPVRLRPGVQRMLQNLAGRAEVVLWTAGERSYAQNAIRSIDSAGAVKHLVARDSRWCRGFTGGTKDLRKLGRDLSRTLIVENTAECVRANTDSAVLVPDFNGRADSVLGQLDSVLHDLLASGLSVQAFLQQSPALSRYSCRTPAGEALSAYGVKGFTPTDALGTAQYSAATSRFGSPGLADSLASLGYALAN